MTDAPAGAFEWREQRVALFVDTQNLFYAARDLSGAAVDYARLLDVAGRGRRMAQATAYVVERQGDTSNHGFALKLTALGYRVRRMQVRVRVGLVDYPRGKSAMVHYAVADDVRAAAVALAAAHPDVDWLCRHLLAPCDRATAVALGSRLVRDFAARFGVEPTPTPSRAP